MEKSVLYETYLPDCSLYNRGKVRDVYFVDEERLLIVATDRVSAYDVGLTPAIPGKGRILAKMTCSWLKIFKDIPNHLITTKVDEYPEKFQEYADQLEGRSMLVRLARVFPVECVVRGYLYGSAWQEYQRKGNVCGIKLPKGLTQGQKLPKPIFTPATKSLDGHDENITFEKMSVMMKEEYAKKLRSLSLNIYIRAQTYASEHGIILADTKFEFGLIGDTITLVDEVLTPDSSRFWLVQWGMNEETIGFSLVSLDKQPIRDYLDQIEWNRTSPAPELPPQIVSKSTERYEMIYQMLFGG